MKPLTTLLTIAVTLSCLNPTAQADRKSREEEKARQQRLERQLRDVEYILQHESDGTLSDRQNALKDMISTGVAPDEAYWQAGYIKKGDQWVSVRDRWLTPEQEQKVDGYAKVRTEFADSDEDHYKLAQWCAENGYDAQAYAHLKAVLLNHPDHAGLRQLLGYEKIGNRWMNADDYKAAVREAHRLAQELRQWGPEVARISDGLNSPDPRQQNRAKAQLQEITNIAAVPAMELILLPSSDMAAAAGVDQLCRIDHRRSSIALCKAAMFLPDSTGETKQAAIAELKTRPLEDFVPVLLGKMQTELTAQFEFQWRRGWEYSYGPFNMPHKYNIWRDSQRLTLAIANESMYELRKHAFQILAYDLSVHTDMAAIPAWNWMYQNWSPTVEKWMWWFTRSVQSNTYAGFFEGAKNSSLTTEDFMPDDPVEYGEVRVEQLDKLRTVNRLLEIQNERIEDSNRRILQLMGELTKQSRFEEPEYWWKWWKSQIDVEDVKIARQVLDIVEVAEEIHIPWSPPSCFTAGTPVWTDRGPRPIEQLHVGDMALTQNVETGELMYRPIIRTTTRQPKPLVTIDLGAEEITSTGGHPFFVPGEGWVRARELKAGQFLHTPTGTIKIDSVTETPEKETYNLVVDAFHTYFVGMSQALVHDVSITSPTDAVVPGLLDR